MTNRCKSNQKNPKLSPVFGHTMACISAFLAEIRLVKRGVFLRRGMKIQPSSARDFSEYLWL